MTRVIRTGNAIARAAAPVGRPVPGRRAAPEPEEAAPLRRAVRTAMPVTQRPSSRHTTTSTHEGRATISEVFHDENLPATRFEPGEEPAKVMIHKGKTIGQPNFSSIRIDVSVSLPCLPEHARETALLASQLVDERLAIEEEYMLGTPAPRSANRRG